MATFLVPTRGHPKHVVLPYETDMTGLLETWPNVEVRSEI